MPGVGALPVNLRLQNSVANNKVAKNTPIIHKTFIYNILHLEFFLFFFSNKLKDKTSYYDLEGCFDPF